MYYIKIIKQINIIKWSFFDIDNKSEILQIMKVYAIILILIMLLTGSIMRVRAQEHQHKTDSTNNIVLYFKIDGAILDSTYMGNNESLKKLDELIKNELIIPNLDSITIVASSSPDGKEAYNLELSRKRAESVKAYITGKYPEIKKELVYARELGWFQTYDRNG